MKQSFIISVLLFLSNSLIAQKPFFSIGAGFSNFSSIYKNRYSEGLILGGKVGYDWAHSKTIFGFSVSVNNLSCKIVELDQKLNLVFARISASGGYALSSCWYLRSQLSIGTNTPKSISISRPKYTYDFDPVDFSYSFELEKKLKIGKLNSGIGLEYSKSLDGIIDNNFWQKDNLKPYYINVNLYYYLDN
jgi:hypothetical protein